MPVRNTQPVIITAVRLADGLGGASRPDEAVLVSKFETKSN